MNIEKQIKDDLEIFTPIIYVSGFVQKKYFDNVIF